MIGVTDAVEKGVGPREKLFCGLHLIVEELGVERIDLSIVLVTGFVENVRPVFREECFRAFKDDIERVDHGMKGSATNGSNRGSGGSGISTRQGGEEEEGQNRREVFFFFQHL